MGEMEKALLAMFVEQGDVSAEVLMQKKAEEEAKKTVIELAEPLDLEASRELMKAMEKYENIEQNVWEEVKSDLKSGNLEVPEEVPESFLLKKGSSAAKT